MRGGAGLPQTRIGYKIVDLSAVKCVDEYFSFRMMVMPNRTIQRSMVLGLGGCCVSCVLLGCNTAKNEMVKPEPPAVTVARPLKQQLRLFIEENGVTEAVSTAEVRSRVQGFIEEVRFEPGQTVDASTMGTDGTKTEGDILYVIEPDKYQAALDSARSAEAASVASVGVAESQVDIAQASVDKTKQEKDRQTELRERGVGSSADYEAAVAAFKSAEANVKAAIAAVELAKAQLQEAQASVANAQLDLHYTIVRAPIFGQVSKTLVKLGNLVENGTHLADVADRSEIFVNFSVGDREALRFYDKQRAAGISTKESRQQWAEQKVYLSREVDTGFPFVGTLDYVDQTGVDPTTGTLGVRAKFDNPDGSLLAGIFVPLWIPSPDVAGAIMIPENCVLRDSKRTYVLTVDSSNQVGEAVIEIGEQVDGWLVVEKGLDDSMQIIVEGIQKTRKGGVVNPTMTTLERKDMWGDELLSSDGNVDADSDGGSETVE